MEILDGTHYPGKGDIDTSTSCLPIYETQWLWKSRATQGALSWVVGFI